ncbi:MAG: hypothetical protein LBQ54_04190 [Planctomycetaceae bacterium]|nr:hypothetical protein [Planctomycetaceae bacterium]
MTQHYKLDCSCGKYVAVTPQQAGQTVKCECGETLTVPSMLQVNKLEPAPDKVFTASKRNRVIHFTENRIVIVIGWLIFIPSLLFLIWLLTHKPTPVDTAWMQNRYTAGGREVRRDSFPLARRDAELLVVYVPQINRYTPLKPEYFENMDPYNLWYYHQLLKKGPALSENFYEKYERLQNFYKIRLGIAGVGLFVAVVLLGLGYFMKKTLK